MKWWSNILGNSHPFGNTWKLWWSNVLGDSHPFGNTWKLWWSNVLGDSHPFGNTWKLNCVNMEQRFYVWLMLNSSFAKNGSLLWCKMLNMEVSTRLSLGWWMGIKTKITLSHVIIFSPTLHCFGVFWRLGCMPQELTRLIGRGGLVL